LKLKKEPGFFMQLIFKSNSYIFNCQFKSFIKLFTSISGKDKIHIINIISKKKHSSYLNRIALKIVRTIHLTVFNRARIHQAGQMVSF